MLRRGSRRRRRPLTVGIVYPTELTDDLSVIELYARWFEARGARVVLGSPFNLRPDGQGGVAMFGVSCSVIWRHYKTDWWGERRTVWRSEDAVRRRRAAAWRRWRCWRARSRAGAARS